MNNEFNPKMQKLKQMQSLPLEQKITYSKSRIKEFLEKMDNCIVSFSGGVDSLVLLNIAREVEPTIKGVFCNTGLEYPDIVKFVKTIPNVDIIKPKMTYKQVIEKYGYPFPSKAVAMQIYEVKNTKTESLKTLRLTGIRPNGEYSPLGKLPDKWHFLLNAPFNVSSRCCNFLKKNPLRAYCKKHNAHEFVGMMAEESTTRITSYLRYSCNAYEQKHPTSRPLMFWTKQDVMKYLKKYNIPYCDSVYGDIVECNGELKFTKMDRTGCTFCMFGVHLESTPNRFQIMQKDNPKMYEYCMNELGIKKVLEYCKIPYEYKVQDTIQFDYEDNN